jgi:hypothetical protein
MAVQARETMRRGTVREKLLFLCLTLEGRRGSRECGTERDIALARFGTSFGIRIFYKTDLGREQCCQDVQMTFHVQSSTFTVRELFVRQRKLGAYLPRQHI